MPLIEERPHNVPADEPACSRDNDPHVAPQWRPTESLSL
jgi:hypothetical protein